MKNNDVKIIAEIGCNHNGNYKIAKEMVDYLISINVDCIKFQIFNSNALISKFAPKAVYQIKSTGSNESQLEMTKKLELTHKEYLSLLSYIKNKDRSIEVFATPFDIESINFLKKCKQKIWKIPSGEITNFPYINELSKINNKDNIFLLSTGMATIDEIQNCLKLLQSNGITKKQIVIFHCNTEYPTPYKDVNLNVFNQFKRIFKGYNFGFSDHSSNIYAALASIPYGVKYIEKHFTLNKSFPGPDHLASLDKKEFKELVYGTKAVVESLGKSYKKPTNSEKKNIYIARKSIVAKTNIKKGEIFTEKNITTKRPGNGISAWYWNNILGMKAEKDFFEDELIKVKKWKK